MRWGGQRVLGTEAICWCIDLRMGLDILTIQLLRRTPLECVCVMFYAVCTRLFDYEFKLGTVKFHHVSAVCSNLYLHDICVSDPFFKRWHMLACSSGSQQPGLNGNNAILQPPSR